MLDSNYNSTYPYAVGPSYYGVKSAVKVTSITEANHDIRIIEPDNIKNDDIDII